MDAVTFKKLNSAAMLRLAHERAGLTIKPSVALTHANLPTGDAMNQRLSRRVGQLSKVMDEVDAPPISPDTRPPKERDDEAESVDEDETPQESQDDSADRHR